MTQGEYDLVSIGFGPAGLALAAAVDERQREAKTMQRPPPRAVFLEKQAKTVWHGGLLLPGTHVNQHLFKDLVTPRNPQSPLSFASYLHEVDRFYEFCIWNGPVSRVEWADYVTWVSTKLRHLAEYDNECIEIDVSENGMFHISTRKRE
jgi:L-ornithine N5-oxygenase